MNKRVKVDQQINQKKNKWIINDQTSEWTYVDMFNRKCQ